MIMTLLALSGCVTPTPYRAADADHRNGYSDQRLADNRIRVHLEVLGAHPEHSRSLHTDYSVARGGTLELPRHARLRFTGGLFGYGLGVLAAVFWTAAAGLVIYALLAVYYVFENLPTPSAEEEGAGDGR
jgi:hypothetical protein